MRCCHLTLTSKKIKKENIIINNSLNSILVDTETCNGEIVIFNTYCNKA